ncbi:MAG: HAD-IC family P-type ATPase [Patescibacteria group bacterium]
METLQFAVRTVAEAFETLGTSESGLASAEARRRLLRFGKNEIRERVMGWPILLVRQFRGPYTALLAGAAALALLAREPVDALTIFIILALSAFLGFFQEFRSEHTLRKLRTLVPHMVTVRRDGAERSLRREELVPGDVVIVTDGDIVPADLRLTVSQGILLDESVLTGESIPVPKDVSPASGPSLSLSDASCVLFQGTTVLDGRGEGVAVATAHNTIFGEVANRAAGVIRPSRFEENLRRFSRFVLGIVAFLLMLIFGAHILVRGPSVNVPELALFIIAIAIGIVPEALPVVTTVTFAAGARMLARKHVVVRRLSAVQDLGDIDLLCVDKTGTLTENRLTLRSVDSSRPEECRLFALLASSPGARRRSATGSSFDIALWREATSEEHAEHDQWKRVWEIPFDPERKRNAVVAERGEKTLLIVRGALETILERSGTLAGSGGDRPLDSAAREMLGKNARSAGERGARVLAVAARSVNRQMRYSDTDERELTLVGLLFFEDPLKPTAAAAVRLAREIGVQVKILTGDAPEVAGAVGRELGILSATERVPTGAEVRSLGEDELRALAERTHAFARLEPKDKYRLLEIFQERHTVGFLGEGVNDAPALAIAHVAVVVQGASDVAREVSDVILLDRDLHVIISGVKIGRKVFANVIKYLVFTMSANFGNLFTIAVISVISGFLPLLPAQILLANLLTDIPMIAIATDRVSSDELRRPRRFQIRGLAAAMLVFGMVSSLFDFIFFGAFRTAPEPVLRTLWFLFTLGTEFAFLFVLRTRRPIFRAAPPSRAIVVSTLGAIAATAIIFATPLRALFHFVMPGGWSLLAISGLTAAAFLVTEVVKNAYYRVFGENGEKA